MPKQHTNAQGTNKTFANPSSRLLEEGTAALGFAAIAGIVQTLKPGKGEK